MTSGVPDSRRRHLAKFILSFVEKYLRCCVIRVGTLCCRCIHDLRPASVNVGDGMVLRASSRNGTSRYS